MVDDEEKKEATNETASPAGNNTPLSTNAAPAGPTVFDKKEHIEMIITALAALIEKISMREIERIYDDRNLMSYREDELVPYVAAVYTLTFLNRDVDDVSIKNLVRMSGVMPNMGIVSAIRLLHIKNSTAYAAAVYYLVAIGKEPTVEGVIDVIKAMQMQPDAALAGYAITFYRLFKDSTL